VSQEIVPQNTGEWRTAFPSFRQSLLGGKSLNRFSTFVTSGAEEWVLKGTAADAVISPDAVAGRHERAGSSDSDSEEAEEERNRLNRLGLGEADHHFVDAGLAWKTKLPPFRVLVHSPSKRTSTLSGAFTIYSVTSLFHPPAPDGNSPPPSPTRITVHRRFSHFVILHTALTRRLPGIALPPLPEKQYAGRFSEDFVEARRGDLERYIGRVVRHPVARYAEVVTFFLGCESDTVRVPPAFLVANNTEMGVGVEAAGPATPGDARGGALLLRTCVPPGL
jgi:sorting nexin-9/18/33